jgi:hypothetical protein
MDRTRLALLPPLIAFVVAAIACGGQPPPPTSQEPARLPCGTVKEGRIDAHAPEVAAVDWGAPAALSAPLNTPCPEDAIEISRDGTQLYFLFAVDLLQNLSPEQIFAAPNGTYRATRSGGPGEFEIPVPYAIGGGTGTSLDGELSFSPDGATLYFHSLRAANTGYQQDPPIDDYLDIYASEIVLGLPGPGRNLGRSVNSAYPDGEQAIHPDGVTLYFTSSRPGGLGGDDIWTSAWDSASWSEPQDIGAPVNSPGNDLQPAFDDGGDTLYFASDRDPAVGMAIYRAHRQAEAWGEPELVIRGIVGEPSLTGDGRLLYFVHVLTDDDGPFDADIWYTERMP